MAQATFVHEGASIDYTASADVAAGEVVVQSELVGVAKTPIAANALGSLAVSGVFDFAKEAGGGVTFAVGDLAYWDDANDVAVTTDGAGANKLIGKCVKAAADADVLVRVRMDQ
jgi:predicted RecA/RadA family phage recombinase